jgi:hypothetical protein
MATRQSTTHHPGYQSTEGVAPAAYKRTSWGAIFAGTVVVLATQILLSMLGIGIGASTVNPMTEQDPASGLGTGAAIWFGISTLISLFLGGWVAGRLAGVPLKTDSMLHGLLTWGLSTLLTFYLLTSAIGGLLGGTARALGGVASTATQGAATAASGAAGQPQIINQARGAIDKAANEAERLKDQAQSNAPELQARARQAGETAASGTSKAAWATFAILLLGAIAAAMGGQKATPRDLAVPLEPIA